MFSVQSGCIFEVSIRQNKKNSNMKATTETKRKDLPNGHYLTMSRRVRVNRNGIKQATGWHIEYDSRRGY